MGSIHINASACGDLPLRQQSIAHITKNPHSLFGIDCSSVFICIRSTLNGVFLPPVILSWALCHIIKCEKWRHQNVLCDQKIICYQVHLLIQHFDQGIDLRKWLFLRVPHIDTTFTNIDIDENEMVTAITKSLLTNNLH